MAGTESQTLSPRTASKRIGIFDVVRGFSLISMILFHLCYDLVHIKGFDVPWFSGIVRSTWQYSISWTFLFVAGCMCPLSRNNLKRAGVYTAVAIGIFAVTSFAGVDTAISFGIIYSMAACTFVYWLLSRLGLEPRGYVCGAILFLGFLFIFDLPHGHVGLGGFVWDLPRAPYDCGLLSWAGFPAPGFSSGDYYPLLPYLFLYLAGAALGNRWSQEGYPEALKTLIVEPFSWCGKHSLLIYVLHQPLILAVLQLI